MQHNANIKLDKMCQILEQRFGYKDDHHDGISLKYCIEKTLSRENVYYLVKRKGT